MLDAHNSTPFQTTGPSSFQSTASVSSGTPTPRKSNLLKGLSKLGLRMWLGLAMLVLLTVGGAAAAYLATTKQDLRQQAAALYYGEGKDCTDFAKNGQAYCADTTLGSCLICKDGKGSHAADSACLGLPCGTDSVHNDPTKNSCGDGTSAVGQVACSDSGQVVGNCKKCTWDPVARIARYVSVDPTECYNSNLICGIKPSPSPKPTVTPKPTMTPKPSVSVAPTAAKSPTPSTKPFPSVTAGVGGSQGCGLLNPCNAGFWCKHTGLDVAGTCVKTTQGNCGPNVGGCPAGYSCEFAAFNDLVGTCQSKTNGASPTPKPTALPTKVPTPKPTLKPNCLYIDGKEVYCTSFPGSGAPSVTPKSTIAPTKVLATKVPTKAPVPTLAPTYPPNCLYIAGVKIYCTNFPGLGAPSVTPKPTVAAAAVSATPKPNPTATPKASQSCGVWGAQINAPFCPANTHCSDWWNGTCVPDGTTGSRTPTASPKPTVVPTKASAPTPAPTYEPNCLYVLGVKIYCTNFPGLGAPSVTPKPTSVGVTSIPTKNPLVNVTAGAAVVTKTPTPTMQPNCLYVLGVKLYCTSFPGSGAPSVTPKPTAAPTLVPSKVPVVTIQPTVLVGALICPVVGGSQGCSGNTYVTCSGSAPNIKVTRQTCQFGCHDSAFGMGDAGCNGAPTSVPATKVPTKAPVPTPAPTYEPNCLYVLGVKLYCTSFPGSGAPSVTPTPVLPGKPKPTFAPTEAPCWFRVQGICLIEKDPLMQAPTPTGITGSSAGGVKNPTPSKSPFANVTAGAAVVTKTPTPTMQPNCLYIAGVKVYCTVFTGSGAPSVTPKPTAVVVAPSPTSAMRPIPLPTDIASFCTKPSDCGLGMNCVANHCVSIIPTPQPCSVFSWCPNGYTCSNLLGGTCAKNAITPTPTKSPFANVTAGAGVATVAPTNLLPGKPKPTFAPTEAPCWFRVQGICLIEKDPLMQVPTPTGITGSSAGGGVAVNPTQLPTISPTRSVFQTDSYKTNDPEGRCATDTYAYCGSGKNSGKRYTCPYGGAWQEQTCASGCEESQWFLGFTNASCN